jgi:dTDP-4-amino-4,6-dideoxygalactose transaminase
VDFWRHHAPIAEELRIAFDSVLEQGTFVLGEEVERFEADFAAFCGARHCVAMKSGTAALTLALRAAGVGKGDEVIMPAHTYIATALAIVHAGAIPRFCDVEEGTGLIDVPSAAEALSSRTRAIIPVHLYGQVCGMESLNAFARRHGLLVIEDAAQAHGARHAGARAGSFGDVAAFSFYPSKNLGALGDGGAICTNDAEIAERGRRLRNMGQRRKGDHVDAGFNERLDALQAAMLRVKLPRLDSMNEARRTWAELYRDVLPPGCRPLEEDPHGECVYHLYPVRVDDRDRVRDYLHRRGIDTGIHYSPAVHRQPPFANGAVRPPGPDLDAAVRWSEEELSLPMFPELTEVEVHEVGAALSSALAEVQG